MHKINWLEATKSRPCRRRVGGAYCAAVWKSLRFNDNTTGVSTHATGSALLEHFSITEDEWTSERRSVGLIPYIVKNYLLKGQFHVLCNELTYKKVSIRTVSFDKLLTLVRPASFSTASINCGTQVTHSHFKMYYFSSKTNCAQSTKKWY